MKDARRLPVIKSPPDTSQGNREKRAGRGGERGRGVFESKERNIREIRRRGDELPHRQQMLACLYKQPPCPLDPRCRGIPPRFPTPSAHYLGRDGRSASPPVSTVLLRIATSHLPCFIVCVILFHFNDKVNSSTPPPCLRARGDFTTTA